MEHVHNASPESKQWSYDFSAGKFKDGLGQGVSWSAFEQSVLRGNPGRTGVGLSTLRRGVLTASLHEASKLGGDAQLLLERGREPSPKALREILYSLAEHADAQHTTESDERTKREYDAGNISERTYRGATSGGRIGADAQGMGGGSRAGDRGEPQFNRNGESGEAEGRAHTAESVTAELTGTPDGKGRCPASPNEKETAGLGGILPSQIHRHPEPPPLTPQFAVGVDSPVSSEADGSPQSPRSSRQRS